MNIRISIPKINQYKIPFQKNSINKENQSNLERTPNNDSFEMSIGYVNDIHGQTNNMMRILSALEGDLKVSSGDNDIGDEGNKKVNKAVVTFMNIAGIKASALGNHELDTTQKDFVDTIKSFKGDILAANLKKDLIEEQSEEDVQSLGRTDLENHIKKSIIVDVKGEKVGLIGATPIDLNVRITHPDYHKDCHVDKLEDTIEDIQEEVDKLKEQGINKIFLLSHLGNKTDKVIVKHLDGVDVILGGHTHELITGIKEGENLFYNKKGEPVIITEAGKDGKYFGKLNLSFDKDGVITKAQNNLGKTNLYHKNLVNQYIFDKILGKPEVVGVIENEPPIPSSLIEENYHANFMCDAMKSELGVDLAIWNTAGTRNYFRKGIIDTSDVKDIAPFADKVAVADVSEETLVNMFKKAIKTTYRSQGNKPGLLGVSGLKYSIDTKKGELAGFVFVDKNGVEHSIDIDNPRKDKKYKIATDSFLMSVGADYDVLAKKEDCKIYPFNKDFVACEYIRHLNKPVVIDETPRITFINGED